MAPKTVCDAHGLLVGNLNEIKLGQNQLFDLDREKAKEMSEMRESVVRLETSTSAGFKAIEKWQNDFEKEQRERDAKILAGLSRNTRPMWTPKNIVALAGAIFGTGGVAAVILIFVR